MRPVDRATKSRDDEYSYACHHEDCRRVVWKSFVGIEGEPPERVDVSGCYECCRPTTFERVEVPEDTIMLDENGDPIPKSEYDEI